MRHYHSIFLHEDVTDPIPDIHKEYRKMWHDIKNYKDGKNQYVSDDFMIVNCKKKVIEDEQIDGHNVKIECDDTPILYNNDGYIEEYNNDGLKKKIKTLRIEDEQTAGNYIIGTLISNLYPDVKTISLNRYRGWSSNIVRGDALHNEYFIADDYQGYDNPFIFVEKLPNTKWFLFNGEYIYNKTYYVDGNIENPISFKEEFDRVAKIQSNFVGIMFFIDRLNGPYEPPTGWTRRTIDFPNQNITECYWVVYERK